MSAQSKGISSANQNPTILEKIYAQRARDVEVAKSSPGTTPEDISNLLTMNLSPPLIALVARLKRNPSSSTSSPSPSLMAEIKRASPSKGPIAITANAAQQAQTYALSGASVISVLTEPTWFKGSLLDLRLVRQAVDAFPDRPAILRKDFILDEYQIAEARLHGADTILLIVAMLSQERLQALYAYSLSLGMEPLVEVNNASEMSRALELGAKVIGVNNRNLHDLNVDMGTTSRLVEMVRQRDVVLCALSGISSPNEVRTYKREGVHAVLVGEALMRAQDTGAFIRELLDWPEQTSDRHDKARQTAWVKATGVTSVSDAVSLIGAGADMLGLVFDPESKDFISLEVSTKISAAIRASQVSPAIGNYSTVPAKSTPWLTTNVRSLTSVRLGPLVVGIFRDQPLPFIQHAAAVAQLDLVQLNGIEPAGWVQHIPVPVTRKFGVGKNDNIEKEITRPGLHAFSLLDLRENDGIVVEEASCWQVARKVVEDGEAPKWPMPIILDGGLTAENVAEAIRSVIPWAVDIHQGTDASKVGAFINAAKGV